MRATPARRLPRGLAPRRVHLLGKAPRRAVIERLPRERPADRAVAQRGDRIRQPRVDERLRADDAARAPRAVHDHARRRIGRELAHPQHEFRARHARRARDAHRLVFVEAPRIDDHDVGPRIDQLLHFLRGQRRRVPLRLDELAERLARHVDVDEELAARRLPAGEPAFEQMHARVAERREYRCRARREILAERFAVDRDRRVAARNARPCVEFELRQRKIRGPQRMAARIWVFLAHVDQRDLRAGEQRGAHVGGG
ncbi:rhodanese-like domain protein [Burkholderia humptydooensis]|nr:rhodanese-like domain protein [Burkholderia sp. 2002721687]